MKRDKTGTEILGTLLFADPWVLTRWRDKLPSAVAEQLQLTRKERPEATPDQLRALLHLEFSLRPLEIHDLASIRIEIPPRDYLNEYRCPMHGHLAEAVIPYSGSALLWKAQQIDGFEFGFPGQVGPSTTRLRTFLEDKDFAWFEEKIQAELGGARNMLELAANGIAANAEMARGVVNRVADKILGGM